MNDTPEPIFVSASGSSGNCAEIATNLATTEGVVLIRDSKDPSGATQRYTLAEWRALITAIEAGQFRV